MAKHRKHKRYGRHKRRHGMRGFGDLVPHAAKPWMAPVAGAAVGLGVGLGVKALASTTSALQSLPTALQNNLVPLGAVLGGVGAYFLRHKKNKSAAVGNLVGAVAAAAVVLGYDYATTNAPQLFSGVMEVNLANGLKAKAMKGLLIANPGNPNRFQGMLVRNPMRGMRGLIIPNAGAGRNSRDVSQYQNAGATTFDPQAAGAGETDYEDENAP